MAYEAFRKQERRGDPLRKAKLVRRCSDTRPGGAAGGGLRASGKPVCLPYPYMALLGKADA